MITKEQVEALADIRYEDDLISSFYLELNPDPNVHQVRAKEMIREQERALDRDGFSKEEIRKAKEDLARIRDFVEGVRASVYHGLAVFSCQARGLWQVFFVARPFRDIMRIEHSPYIRPLSQALNEFRRVCTLLVDRERARIFEIFMGEIEEHSEIYDDVPARVREGGWGGYEERRIERHIDFHLRHHLKNVSERTFNFFREKKFDWLFLGGQLEAVNELQNVLPSELQDRVKEVFHLDMLSSPKDVLEKTLEMEKEAKEKEDLALISRLRESLGREGLGVTGIDETLSSLQERTAHILFLEKGFSQPGAYCPRCRHMERATRPCPYCGEKMIESPDIVEEALALAAEQDCRVVHVNPGGLKEFGGMGALLRYKPGIEKRPAGERSRAAET